MNTLLKLPWITHTHYDCRDLWNPYVNEMNRYMPMVFKSINHIYMVNTSNNNRDVESFFNSNVHFYDDSIPYPSRLLSILHDINKKGHKYVIIDHEDMFLYDYPNLNAISDAFRVMQTNNIDSIRFSKSTNCLASEDKNSKDLMHISLESDWIFSVQPCIWNIESYIRLLSSNATVNIWELETLSQEVVRKLKFKICYLSGKGKKRGLYHYDSSIYPYIATALFKGKWVINEYPDELQQIFVRYNINPRMRGFS